MSVQPGRSVADHAERHALDLLRFAYLLSGDRHRAEDLLQDVLLSLHRKFPGPMPLDNPVGYARRALANANVSRARRSSSTELVVGELPDTATAEADPAEIEEIEARPPGLKPAAARKLLDLADRLDTTLSRLSPPADTASVPGAPPAEL